LVGVWAGVKINSGSYFGFRLQSFNHVGVRGVEL
jgi:hypothetical protein